MAPATASVYPEIGQPQTFQVWQGWTGHELDISIAHEFLYNNQLADGAGGTIPLYLKGLRTKA